jgi:tetratricopeptide (TPR) repeat protein
MGRRALPILRHSRYKELLPKVKYQGNINFDIGAFYFNRKEYNQSLPYFLNSIHINQKEQDLIDRFFINNPTTASDVFHTEEDKYASIVRIYALLNKWEELIPHAGHLPDQEKYAAEKYKYLSIAYAKKEEIESAIEAMKKYVKLKNDDASLWNFLGCLYLRRVLMDVWTGDDIDRAITAFNKTLELDSNNSLAYFHLYAIYSQNGNQKKEHEYLAKLKSLNFDLNTLIQKKDGCVQIKRTDE